MDRRYSQPWLITTLVLAFVLNADGFPAHAQTSKQKSHPHESRAQRIARLNDALLDAASSQKLDQVKMLLARGANPNGDAIDAPPLLEAVTDGNEQIVQLLLSHGAKTNVSDGSGDTPLVNAVLGGDQTIVLTLLAHGADPNKVGTYGYRSLHAAAANGNETLIHVLLAHGANPKAKDKDGQTPFACAMANKYYDAADLLAKVTPGAVITQPSLLVTAVRHANLAQVKAVLAAQPNVNGRDAAHHEKTPLMLAAENIPIITEKDPTLRNATGKLGSTSSASAQAVLLSFQQRNRKLRAQDDEIVQLLLMHGVIVDAKDDAGGTALDYATSFGDVITVKALLAHGAKPNLKDIHGITPLMNAIYGGPASSWLLHTYGSQEPVEEELQEMIAILMSYGTAINAQDEDGATALMLATHYNNAGPVRWLLAAGADPRLKDKKGKTALDYARQGKNQAAIPLLESALRKKGV